MACRQDLPPAAPGDTSSGQPSRAAQWQDQAPHRGRRHLPQHGRHHAVTSGAVRPEQTDERAVQRARHMTPETIAPIPDEPIIGLPEIADRSARPCRSSCSPSPAPPRPRTRPMMPDAKTARGAAPPRRVRHLAGLGRRDGPGVEPCCRIPAPLRRRQVRHGRSRRGFGSGCGCAALPPMVAAVGRCVSSREGHAAQRRRPRPSRAVSRSAARNPGGTRLHRAQGATPGRDASATPARCVARAVRPRARGPDRAKSCLPPYLLRLPAAPERAARAAAIS